MGKFMAHTESCASVEQRGQTETLGVILLLAITVIGAMSVVAFGATAFQDARGSSGYESVGHAMTQFDSQAAMVGLGDTNTQSVQLPGTNNGAYTVEPDEGWMKVTHENGSDTETFVNSSLGALVYSDGDVEIAYQGGGVWRKQGGGSTMVSPPEFHYRDATLTLPIISVDGTDSASGSVRASLANEMSARAVFPNGSKGSYWDDNQYRNPVSEGNVTVTVRSEYYQAWAEYFRTRSDGNVTVDHSNETVQLVLLTPNTLGDFHPVGDGISIHQLGEEHPVSDFNITLIPANPGNGNNKFKDMQWSFSVEKGSQEFEILFEGSPCKDDELDAHIYYHNGSGVYEGWHTTFDLSGSQDVVDVTCADELTINFTGTAHLEYKEDIDTTIGTTDHDFATNITFDQHTIDNDTSYDADKGDSEELGFLVNHYLELMGPRVDLAAPVKESNGNGQIDEARSFGYIDYEQGEGPRYITFLHVTENRVNVELE